MAALLKVVSWLKVEVRAALISFRVAMGWYSTRVWRPHV